MLNKTNLLDAMLLEIKAIGHLAEKAQNVSPDYRPTPGQRSTIEVMRYAAFCGMGAATSALDGNWDRYKEWSEKTSKLTMAEIPAAMETQANALKGLFGEISDEQFANQTAKNPLGQEMPLGQAMLDMSMRWLTGYKMQAFLYLKSSGLEALSTPDCWYGIDPPKEA